MSSHEDKVTDDIPNTEAVATPAAEQASAPTPTPAAAAAPEPEQEVPLTPAQKEAKLNLLRERAAERRREQERLTKEENRKNDAIRRKRDAESSKAYEDLQRKEALKDAERKRRQVKEDALAKQRIRERIEADKEARRKERLAKEGGAGAESSAAQPAATTATKPAPAAAPASRPAPTESTLRIRLAGQPPSGPGGLTRTFPVVAKLGDVAADISPEVGIPALALAFQTTFPTKTYGPAEFEKTLKEVGLVNANVIVKQV